MYYSNNQKNVVNSWVYSTMEHAATLMSRLLLPSQQHCGNGS